MMAYEKMINTHYSTCRNCTSLRLKYKYKYKFTIKKVHFLTNHEQSFLEPIQSYTTKIHKSQLTPGDFKQKGPSCATFQIRSRTTDALPINITDGQVLAFPPKDQDCS